LWLSADFPRKVEDLMPVFEVLSPRNKHFQKLQDFVKLLPTDGFPVKVGTLLSPPTLQPTNSSGLDRRAVIADDSKPRHDAEVPVFPTLSGLASFGKYEETELDESLFVVPSNYSIKVCPLLPSTPSSSSPSSPTSSPPFSVV
jgi:hypothetical protein